MSVYKDIIVIKEKGDCYSPELTADTICELLAHKNRCMSGVEKIALDAKNLEECIGGYCNILNENTISFSFKHYNSIFLPLWFHFKSKMETFDFLDFTSEEGVSSLKFESAFSPNIIYCSSDNGELGMSLEDFMRSDYFGTSNKYEVLNLWCHHE